MLSATRRCAVMLPDLNEDVERLIGCQTEERINPHHVGREAD